MNKFLLFNYLIEKAEICYQEKEFTIALEYLNEALFLSDSLTNKLISEAYELRGIVKMNLKQHIFSIIDFNKAINLFPNNASLYFYRYLSHSVLSQYDEAIEDCKKLIELEPHENTHRENLEFLENINK